MLFSAKPLYPENGVLPFTKARFRTKRNIFIFYLINGCKLVINPHLSVCAHVSTAHNQIYRFNIHVSIAVFAIEIGFNNTSPYTTIGRMNNVRKFDSNIVVKRFGLCRIFAQIALSLCIRLCGKRGALSHCHQRDKL